MLATDLALFSHFWFRGNRITLDIVQKFKTSAFHALFLLDIGGEIVEVGEFSICNFSLNLAYIIINNSLALL